jgi:hypothetical protein
VFGVEGCAALEGGDGDDPAVMVSAPDSNAASPLLPSAGVSLDSAAGGPTCVVILGETAALSGATAGPETGDVDIGVDESVEACAKSVPAASGAAAVDVARFEGARFEGDGFAGSEAAGSGPAG